MGITGKIFRFLVIAGAFGLVPALAQAQGTTISGQVTGAGGVPIVGASVSIPTLRVGAFTDDQGRYTFVAPPSANGTMVTVAARRLGYQPSSASVTLSGAPVTQNFSLSAAATELQGVVVTALGLTRERSQLGTAVQQISSSDLNVSHDMNIVNQLSGKVSGVVMSQSGTQGGSTNIVIRGQNSITGNNQPLFIVDGVPISNQNHGSSSYGGGLDIAGGGANFGGAGKDFGSAIDDINPEDVATVSVLKGPNAAALYGSRAANGVVLITTKKGANTSGRVQTQLTTSYTWDKPSILPDYQNEYGQGAGGEFYFLDGRGHGVNDGLDQSFGPRLDGRSTGCTFVPGTPDDPFAPHVYDSSVPCAQFFAPNGAPWVAHPDNVSSFFNTGKTLASTLAFSGGTDRAQARLSVGSQQVQGIVPNNTFRKFNGLLNGTLNVTSKLTASGDIQYINN